MKITYKAPASLILSGDFSLLYGEPGLFSTFEIYNTFSILETKKTSAKPEEIVSKIQNLLEQYLQENNLQHTKKPFEYFLKKDIPQNQGFGSTASLVVCICSGILEYFTGKQPSKEEIYLAASYVLNALDNTKTIGQVGATVYGGLNYFRQEFDFLNFQVKLPFEINSEVKENFYLVYSGDRTESGEVLKEKVSSLLQENPARLKKVFRDIGKTTKAMTLAFKENREKLLMDTLLKNARLLTHLDVVAEPTSNLLTSMEGFGFGKTTGFAGFEGHSGYIIFCAYTKAKGDLEEFLEKRRLPYIKVAFDENGLKRVEE